MASRDGVKFKRWNEAFLTPGIERPGTWHYGQQYIAWHVVETEVRVGWCAQRIVAVLLRKLLDGK